LTKKKF